MVDANLPEIGTQVAIHTANHNGVAATVRYVGTVSGVQGTWVGVELSGPTGKNDGIMNGITYFACKPNHGLFVRPNQVKKLQEERKARGKKSAAAEEEKKGAKEDAIKLIEEKKQAVRARISESKRQAKQEEDEPPARPSKIDIEDTSQLKLTIKQKNTHIKNLQEEIAALKEQLSEAEQSANKESQQLLQLKDQEIAKLQKQLQEAKTVPTTDDETQELIEALTLEKEIAEENIEALQKEIQELKDEIVDLKEEIELHNLEQEMDQIQDAQEDVDVDTEQLKIALKKLYADHQALKTYYEDKVLDLEAQLSEVPALHKKLQQMEDMRSLIQSKDQEMENLREAIDETSGYQDMIEELTNENLRLTERVAKLQDELTEMEELHELDEQVAESQADFEKQLTNEIHSKEVEIARMANEIEQLTDEKKDLENVINQFRTRVSEQQKEISMLRDEISQKDDTDRLSKMQELIDKNLNLSQRIRILKSNQLESAISALLAKSSNYKSQYITNTVPRVLIDQLEITSLGYITSLSTIRDKSLVLFRELIDRFTEIFTERSTLRWVFGLCSLCIELTVLSGSLYSQTHYMTLEQYTEIMKCSDWGNLSVVNSAIDYFINMVKEEAISNTISHDSLRFPIEALKQFKQEQGIQDEERYVLVRGVLLAELGVITLLGLYDLDQSITGNVVLAEVIKRANYVSERLVQGWENDAQMLVQSEQLTAKFLEVSNALEGPADRLKELDWKEWFSGIDRDYRSIQNMAVIRNDPTEGPSGPWNLISAEIRGRLEQFENTLKELNDSKSENKQLQVKILMIEKELSEIRVSKKSLETRLADAHAKSMKLSQLELDMKNLQTRDKYFQESLDNAQNENAELQKKIKELEEKEAKFKEGIMGDPRVSGGSIMAGESGSLVGSLGGGIGLRSGSQLLLGKSTNSYSLEDFEVQKNIIERLESEGKRHKSEYMRTLAATLPPFEYPKKSEYADILPRLYTAANQLNLHASRMKIMSIQDKDAKLKHMQDFIQTLERRAEEYFV